MRGWSKICVVYDGMGSERERGRCEHDERGDRIWATWLCWSAAGNAGEYVRDEGSASMRSEVVDSTEHKA